MERVQADLAELASILDAGQIEPLRNTDPPRGRVREQLSHFTPHVWIFPFDLHPDPSAPIEVYRNGILQMIGGDCRIVRVGTRRKLSAVVFDDPLPSKDVVLVLCHAEVPGS